ncbi:MULTISPECIES: hypothetical protein [unclassified Pseudomonas]|uniref:hypothetical protein n=1 Tax=unclassified Pseudomonas TaxID=196821 RepID=UPI00159FA91B|nr:MULTISPECIES: hypothetical protein [unclassified Pseudomonas]NWC93693.1 hypothetical protein [Pseudomonas sp. IPO3779]NWD18340.1 hypothetical protein [Pseudomonas sp. IPO3778]
MEAHRYGNNLQGDGTINTTVIDWDEFRKTVKVGDTISEQTRTLTVTDKVYELTASGQHFVIHVYVQ